MRRIPTVAALLLALAACGGDGDPGGTPTPGTTSAAPSTPASPTATATGPRCALPTPAAAGATIIEATVEGGRVSTAQRRYDVKLGSPVRITVTADVADEVHVHSYDRKVATRPGCPVSLDFVANVPGSVEVELEKGHLQLFEVRAR